MRRCFLAIAMVAVFGLVPLVDAGEAARPWVDVRLHEPAGTSAQAPSVLEVHAGAERIALRRIPAGSFVMGSPTSESERQADEGPQHEVHLPQACYLGSCEISNAQFRLFRPDHHSGPVGSKLDGDEQPVVDVSWYDAVAYCQWLSARLGRVVRLPTEAEWEYACRAGSTTRFWNDDHATLKHSRGLQRTAWYGANSKSVSHPIGRKDANPFGLHDMHGNAWEWCWDRYAPDAYQRGDAVDPQGPERGRARVLRGGCYFYWETAYCRSAARYSSPPAAREPVVGFRVLLDLSREHHPLLDVVPPDGHHPRPVPIAVPPDAQERELARRFGAPTAVAPSPQQRPEIDGAFDDACWAQARGLTLRSLFNRGALPQRGGTVRVLADREALYVAFDCAEDDLDGIGSGDSFDIFLDPGHHEEAKRYFLVSVRADGSLRCGRDHGAEWAAADQVTAVVRRHAFGWRGEVVIPFAAFGFGATPPRIWGVNFVRYRPPIGAEAPRQVTLVPHNWPMDRPDRLRLAEATGWAPTYSHNFNIPARFGHLLLEVGEAEAVGSEVAFEIIAREDFEDGEPGAFAGGADASGGAVIEDPYAGQRFAFRVDGTRAAVWDVVVPQGKIRGAGVFAVLRSESVAPPGSERIVSVFTRGTVYGLPQKLCPGLIQTLTRDGVLLPPSFNWNHGSGRPDRWAKGVADPYHAGFEKHLCWYSEATIGRVFYAGGPHYSVVYAPLDAMTTQHPHHKPIAVDRDELHGIYIHGRSGVRIDSAVLFRGSDIEPPERVEGLRWERAGERVRLRWSAAADNLLTVWYRVVRVDEHGRLESVAEAADLEADLPFAEIRGARIAVQAVDYFENVSDPSEAVLVW